MNTTLNLFIKRKAVILDLDNTIYSVQSIGSELFASLFHLIVEEGNHAQDIDTIKDEIMRRPFQVVASKYKFSEDLTRKGIALLKDLKYEGKIEPFRDYEFLKKLPVDKHLVTTGFLKLQQSKVDGMRLDRDFVEVHIIDPSNSNKTKKDVFADIISRRGYLKEQVLVVGDDPDSEIKAAYELGIDAVLYDKFHRYSDHAARAKISIFQDLTPFL